MAGPASGFLDDDALGPEADLHELVISHMNRRHNSSPILQCAVERVASALSSQPPTTQREEGERMIKLITL